MFRKSLLTALPLLVIFGLLSSVLAGCSGGSGSAQDQSIAMASMDGMPDEVKSAAVSVKQAYQFAAANPEVLKQFPCYCGCGQMGHTSNYTCYVKAVDSAGTITYDPHALGCSICVDITQDVMRLLKGNKPIPEIQAYIDATYSKYGPSNFPGAALPSGSQGYSARRAVKATAS